MSDELVREILEQTLESVRIVRKRCSDVQSAEDFTRSDAGLEKLDAVCMKLIAIGESIKNLDKASGGKLLARYVMIDWKKVMGMRDIITHHYFDLDAEVVFDVCRNHLADLENTISAIINDLNSGL